jgi:hypothetical protein
MHLVHILNNPLRQGQYNTSIDSNIGHKHRLRVIGYHHSDKILPKGLSDVVVLVELQVDTWLVK